jgi:hypothetical protein
VDITRMCTCTVDIDIQRLNSLFLCLPKTYLFSQPKSRRTQTDKDVTHNIRLDSEGQGFIQRGEVQQPLPEYRIDYGAPRVAHRSCSALRRLPARARPDLLASSVWRRLAHRSD